MRRKKLLTIGALSATIVSLVVAGPAHANTVPAAATSVQSVAAGGITTAQNNIARVVWHISPGGAGPTTARNYTTMIRNLRRAASNPWRQDMSITSRDTHRLVRLEVHLHQPNFGGTARLDLYFTAADLYLRGWSSPNLAGDDLIQFPGYDLGARLPGVQRARTATFGGGYDSLQTAADQTRRAWRIGRTRLYNQLVNLATDLPQPNSVSRMEIARGALSVVIGVAEAARFGGIAANIAEGIRVGRSVELTARQVRLTNYWERMSNWARNYNDTGNSLALPEPIGNVHSLNQLNNWVDVIQSSHGPVRP